MHGQLFSMTQMDARISELVARLTALERERAEIVVEIDTLRSARSEKTAAIKVVPSARAGDPIDRNSPIEKKIALFRRLFRGRSDVFPIRWENRTTGRSGYAPACANEWQRGICEKPKVKCSACPNQAFLAVDDVSIERHLRGTDANGAPFVMGVYPMLADNTCSFLAADFDEGEWRRDVFAFRETCSVTEYLLPLSGRDPETVLTPGSFSRSRYRQHWRAVSEHSLSPTRWNVSPISDSDPTIGFFQARIQCRRVGSAI